MDHHVAARIGRRFIRKHPLFANLITAFRRRSPAARSTAAHFRHVIDLAAAELGQEVQAPHEAQYEPLVSFVVPVFNTKPNYLDDLLASFKLQPQEFCELILSDDGSTSPLTQKWLDSHAATAGVTVLRKRENRGIAAATNRGIAHAAGRWIGLVDHDDALAPFAVSQIAKALENAPACQFLYTDEVIADRHLRPVDYFLKPAWDPVLLSGANYINHLSLYRRDRLLKISGLRDGFQGSQDYDLLLRYTSGLRPEEILHLPFPTYLWRRDGAGFSSKFLETATANARRALAETYAQGQRLAIVDQALTPDLHRIRFDLVRSEWPLVSVVIPSRDALPLIAKALEGLTKMTDYPALEIIVIDNGSKDPDVLALYERYRRGSVPFTACIEEEQFNFSRSINRGIAMAKGDAILLLNNDIEILEHNWLKEMVSCFDYPETGIVGAKLLYPDRTIQHVGVIAGLGGLAGHWFIGRDERCPGPMGRLRVRLSLSVVTGACMLISRSCIEQTGPFDEKVFSIAYNDVDYCLRAVSRGFRVVWTPFATLIHHESASRGSDEVPEHIERFRRDKQNLRARHRTDKFEDRAFNPWYSKDRSDPVPILLEQLPCAR
jgi:GT2 family glycosyltransferase